LSRTTNESNAGADNGLDLGDRTDETTVSLAVALSEALDVRNPRGKGHSQRVAMYAMAIVNEMGHDDTDTAYQELRNRIRMAALLHDVGKIGIPDSVLRMEGVVGEEGSRLIRQHPVLGAEILRHCRALRDLVPGVLYHHERNDGSGYPFGLTGEKIPVSAKVIAVADTLDLMTSELGGVDLCSPAEAVDRLTGELAPGFDPGVLDALTRAGANGMLRHVHLPYAVEVSDEPIDSAVDVIYGRQLKSIPTLPDALYKVNALLESPEASLKEVADMLATDAGLASRVLKLVNSAYYGLSRTVATIPLATTILGIKAIKNQVVNIAYADVMSELGGRYEEYRILWRHALKTAAWARAIASEISDIDIEEAFTAGLVHDVGRALSLRLKPETYGRLVTESQISGKPLIAAEEEVMGFDHMRMGAWMASRWMLPRSLLNAIRWHHEPQSVVGLSRESYELARVIHIADIAAKASEAVEVRFVPFVLRELSHQVLRDLGSAYVVDLERFREAVEEVETELESTFAEAVTGMC
jgi:putative nucleotidyltransferase with HDIG domain